MTTETRIIPAALPGDTTVCVVLRGSEATVTFERYGQTWEQVLSLDAEGEDE